jgi:hypothetical protein
MNKRFISIEASYASYLEDDGSDDRRAEALFRVPAQQLRTRLIEEGCPHNYIPCAVNALYVAQDYLREGVSDYLVVWLAADILAEVPELSGLKPIHRATCTRLWQLGENRKLDRLTRKISCCLIL